MNLKFIHEDGSKIDEHDITLKTEVLLELIAGVHADLGRYMKEQNISKEEIEPQHPLTVIYWDLVTFRNQLFKVETMEEVMAIQHKTMYIRDLIKKIGA